MVAIVPTHDSIRLGGRNTGKPESSRAEVRIADITAGREILPDPGVASDIVLPAYRGAVQLRNKVVETIIIISLLPVFPVIATWFLPWERWVPKWLPNKIIGPYLLYCAFAAWYFTMPIWTIALVAVLGIGVSAAAIAESRGSSKSK